MQTLHYADEVRPFDEVPVGDAEVKDAELKLAVQLIEQIAVRRVPPRALRGRGPQAVPRGHPAQGRGPGGHGRRARAAARADHRPHGGAEGEPGQEGAGAAREARPEAEAEAATGTEGPKRSLRAPEARRESSGGGKGRARLPIPASSASRAAIPSRASPATSWPASAARACGRGAARWRGSRSAASRTRSTGAGPCPAGAIRGRACSSWASPPPRTAATAPAASSPATARAISSSPPSIAPGFANQPMSIARGDGLRLRDCYVAAVARCAPPGEQAPARARSAAAASTWPASGRCSRACAPSWPWAGWPWTASWPCCARSGRLPAARRLRLRPRRRATTWAPACGSSPRYHPSQQNTFTGKLTAANMDAVLAAVKRMPGAPAAGGGRDAPCARRCWPPLLAGAVPAAGRGPLRAASPPRPWAATSRTRSSSRRPTPRRRAPLSRPLRPARPLREPAASGSSAACRASSTACGRAAASPEIRGGGRDGDNSFFVNGPLRRLRGPRDQRPARPRGGSLPRACRAARAARCSGSPWAATPRCASPSAARGLPRGGRAQRDAPGGRPHRRRRRAALAHGRLPPRLRRSHRRRAVGGQRPAGLAPRGRPRRRRLRSTSTAAPRTATALAGATRSCTGAWARGVAHEFALRPGDHGYDYVRSVLGYSLRFLSKALSGPARR